MRPGVGCLMSAIVLGLAAEAGAQVIQLPSFSSFGVDTTVIVPDSGRARAGGAQRGSSASNSTRGIPGNRAAGVNRQAAGTHVTVQIHDPQAADARALQHAPTPRAAIDPPAVSMLEMAHRRVEKASAQQREAEAVFAKGRRAQATGKPSVASIYYRMAARQANGELRTRIETEWSEATAAGVPATYHQRPATNHSPRPPTSAD